MNTKLKLIIGLLCAWFSICASRAQLIAYDSMSYSGTQINVTTVSPSGTPTQTSSGGFTGNWSGGALTWNSTGVAYAGLPVAGGSISSLGANNLYEKIASAPSSGSVWVSFLFKQGGDNGGNRSGVILEDTTGTGVMLSYQQLSGTQGKPCLMKMSSTTTTGTQLTPNSSTARTYANTNLYVLQFTYTAGVVSSISVYSNPTAGQSNAPAADFTVSSGLPSFGALVKIGLVDGSAMAITLDEFRVGNTFADVDGYIPPPAAPTGLTGTNTGSVVTLTWNPVSGAAGYLVLRGTSSGGEAFLASDATTNYTDSSGVAGSTYYYEVEATNSTGASSPSGEVSITLPLAPPSPPSGLTAVGTNGAVILGWTAGAGAASYNVKRSTTSGAESTITNVAGTSFTDSSVINGQIYYYEVSSTNSAAESANTSEVSATPNVPPPAPASLSATAGTNSVALSWTASAGATSYNVKRSTTSSAEVTITNVATASFTDTTAVKFTQYFYVVSAVSSYGESSNSSETNATPTGSYGPTAYESFNYSTGSFPNNTASTATGFTGNWTIPTAATITTGLTYSNLPTGGNAYLHVATGSQNYENLASPLSSGTKYISFLIKDSGNSGGDSVGVFLKGNNANSLFCGFEGGFSATQTSFGLGTVNSTALGAATAVGATTPIGNTNVHFVVLKIDFNTSGNNDTVSLWIDPPASTNAPGVAANVVNSTVDVGTISAIGINILGGYAVVIDEFRVGDLYGDVVGYGGTAVPTIATTVALSAVQGEQISWTAQSTNTYQLQHSTNNSTWVNEGGILIGNAVSSAYETNPVAYYQTLEYLPGGPGSDILQDGSFEIPAGNNIGAANWSGPASNGSINQYVTNMYGALSPTDGTNMLYLEGQGGASSLVQSDPVPVTGGLTYKVVFDAANALKSGGGNPQFRVEYLDSVGAVVSSSGFVSIASAGSSFVTFSNNYAAPGNAVNVHIGFLEAVGAGGTDHWITLVDNVHISALATIASTNVLATTVKPGGAFTAVVQTNGVTATGASGTIAFFTNSVGLSTNTVALGSATSATAIITPAYTVKAIYSGDNTYIGSTNTLTVNNAPATVTLGNLNQNYDGTAKSVSVTTIPSGLTVNVTYNGSSSAPTNAGTYTVVGTVSDLVYAGSATNSLVISNSVSITPINITSGLAGNQLTFSWPSDHTGWKLQSQTNSLATGISGPWYDVAGSSATNQVTVTVDPTSPSVFFRLTYP